MHELNSAVTHVVRVSAPSDVFRYILDHAKSQLSVNVTFIVRNQLRVALTDVMAIINAYNFHICYDASL